MTQPTNGARPAAPQPTGQPQQTITIAVDEGLVEQLVSGGGYMVVGEQLGAFNVLLGMLPLAALLAANRRLQARGGLVVPGQAQAVPNLSIPALRNDERLIVAALHLQQTVLAVAQGR